jgi:anti-sigma regulatory factor (Ser/Thr protein kinase)
MAATAPGLEVLADLRAGSPVDALPVLQKLVVDIVREGVSEGGEVYGTSAVRVGRLRRIAGAKLASWGLSAQSDDALLLISELVTNGLRYGRGRHIEFRMVHVEGALAIEVDDHSSSRPVIRDGGLDAVSGRGMFLVDALADAWGVSEDGTRTWCALGVPSAEPGST